MLNLKGARWYKTDLHLHTPASKCFTDKNVTPTQWVDKCIEEGLNCVAVTDHNTGEYVDAIIEAAKDKNLTVFPGVEVTCSDSKVHVLVLFDKNKRSIHVNSFLSRLKLEVDKFGEQDAKVNFNVMEVIKEATEMGALAIPAHIDQFSGLGSVDHATREAIFTSEHVYGVQAVHKSFYLNLSEEETNQELTSMYGEGTVSREKAKEWKKALLHALEKPISILTFSDNPAEEGSTKHGLWGIGKRYTWLKMDEEINLESLRQSLMLPELRVSNDFQGEGENPYSEPDFLINNIKISNTRLNEDNEELIYFNPQMTTIIGGRGTGKSGVLRFIRGIFNRNNELEEHIELYKEQQDFYTTYSNTSDNDVKGVLKESSIIEVIFSRYNIPYKIKACNFQRHSQEIVVERWNEEILSFETLDQQDSNSILKLFKFDIYSQKQIYEIAKKPNALRDKIDISIPNMDEVLQEKDRIRVKYMHQSSKLRALKSELEYKPRILTEIDDKENQLKKFREGNYQELFEKNKQFSNENLELSQLDKSLEENRDKIKGLVKDLTLKNIDIRVFLPEHLEEINEINDTVNTKFEIVQANLVDLITIMDQLRVDTQKLVQKSKWYNNYITNIDEYNKTKEEIGEKGIIQLQNLEKLSAELEQKKEQLENIKKVEAQIESEEKILDKIRLEYLAVRKQVTEVRKAFISEVIGESDKIKMTIKRFRDRQNFESLFRKVIQKEDTYSTEINNILDFCFHGNIENKIPELLRKIHNVRKGENDDIIVGRFVQVIKSLNDEQIDELMLIMPEDEISVEYKANNGTFRPLSNASAGQKTSAILTFLLSYGDVPLILDQPEDDLDNYLIYDLIVERLKSTKSKRQIVIVTHNANIPVNGDSELVIAMDSHSTCIQADCSGSIENEDIRNRICDVMEGGKDAFKLRARRYNLTYVNE
ncbi:TrlF family AAA-like ATPase [Peribacillus frigoritolerans]|uniref:TrlF family AAA-like ATPase n=1 Tax=Peribacillus frigoritolerans TaxID=450367 RepID=UPI00345DE60F